MKEITKRNAANGNIEIKCGEDWQPVKLIGSGRDVYAAGTDPIRRRNGLRPIIETAVEDHGPNSGADEAEVTDSSPESWSETVGTGPRPQGPRHYKKRRPTASPQR